MSEFNPRNHLRIIERRQKQKDGSYQLVQNEYLDSKWRVMWFRGDYPVNSDSPAHITTELLHFTPDYAVVRATAEVMHDRPGEEDDLTLHRATGLGCCFKADWSRFLEKAETAAVGRALALLGYGTQFAEELDEGDDPAGLADSPQEKPAPQTQRGASWEKPAPPKQPSQQSQGNEPPAEGNRMEQPATPKQVEYIKSLAGRQSMNPEELWEFTTHHVEHDLQSFSGLTKGEASELIDALQAL